MDIKKINPGGDAQVKDEVLLNADKSHLENINHDHTHCFETTDSHIKIEIEDDVKYLWNEYSFSPNKVLHNHSIDTELQSTNQHQRFPEVENNKSRFENVENAHHFEAMDSDVQTIDNLKEDMDNVLWNDEPELKVNKPTLWNFENNDNIYISENPISNFEDNVDDDKLVGMINIKQEADDKQVHITENKYDSIFRKNELIDRSDLSVKAETYTSDLEAMSSNYENSSIDAESHFVNNDLKLENEDISNRDTNTKLENNDSFSNRFHFNVTRSDLEFENNPSIMGMNLKIEGNDSNIVKPAFGNDTMKCINKRSGFAKDIFKLSSVDHKLGIGKDLQPIVLLKRLPDSILNLRYQVYQISQRDSHLGLQEHISYDHLHTRKSDLPRKCLNTDCEKGFKTQYELSNRSVPSHKCGNKNQMTIQSTESPYQCNICDKGFDTKRKLKQHKNKNNLRQHLTSHSPERPHRCIMCEKRFKNMDSLRQHLTSHSSERPHQCNMCEKRFKNKNNLRQHLTSHITEKPHQCNMCEKKFKTIDSLRHHLTSHTSERPHQCNMCDTRFKKKNNLRQHLISHSTERPHQCNICEKRFNNTDSLRQHLTSHSSEGPHQCNMCEKRFKKKNNLRQHLTSHSSEKPHP